MQRAPHPAYMSDPRMPGNLPHSGAPGAPGLENAPEQEGLDDLLGVYTQSTLINPL